MDMAGARQLVILHPHQLRSFEVENMVLYKETTAQAEVVPICAIVIDVYGILMNFMDD